MPESIRCCGGIWLIDILYKKTLKMGLNLWLVLVTHFTKNVNHVLNKRLNGRKICWCFFISDLELVSSIDKYIAFDILDLDSFFGISFQKLSMQFLFVF